MFEPPRPNTIHIRLISAGAFLSVLVATNLFLTLFCGSWPLLFYLLAGALGAWAGPFLHRRFTSRPQLAKIVRAIGIGLAAFSALGLAVLFLLPVNWDAKCAFAHCGRALGPGLMESPFPVGTPTCKGWSICVNEYQYSNEDYADVLKRMKKQGCPEP